MSRSRRAFTCMKTKHFQAIERRRHILTDRKFLTGLTHKERQQFRRLTYQRRKLLTPFYAPILARLESGEV